MCDLSFESPTDYQQHIEMHKAIPPLDFINVKEEVVTDEIDTVGEVVEISLAEEEEEEENGERPISTTDELLYILDDNQCVNEVVIEHDEDYITNSKENYQTQVVKEEFVVRTAAAGNKKTSPVVKPLVKQKHEVPHFSAANYILLSPNEEVNIQHYKCLRCEQLFISKFVFYRHIEKGKCFINSCDICPARFTKNSDFYVHYLNTHTDRAICNFCFRTFMYEKNVKEHMLRHLDQFRHRCEDCNKGFYTIREYRNHYKNRHMGIRHKCETCNRTFADEYYFKRHIASHTNSTGTESTAEHQ